MKCLAFTKFEIGITATDKWLSSFGGRHKLVVLKFMIWWLKSQKEVCWKTPLTVFAFKTWNEICFIKWYLLRIQYVTNLLLLHFLRNRLNFNTNINQVKSVQKRLVRTVTKKSHLNIRKGVQQIRSITSTSKRYKDNSYFWRQWTILIIVQF